MVNERDLQAALKALAEGTSGATTSYVGARISRTTRAVRNMMYALWQRGHADPAARTSADAIWLWQATPKGRAALKENNNGRT